MISSKFELPDYNTPVILFDIDHHGKPSVCIAELRKLENLTCPITRNSMIINLWYNTSLNKSTTEYSFYKLAAVDEIEFWEYLPNRDPEKASVERKIKI